VKPTRCSFVRLLALAAILLPGIPVQAAQRDGPEMSRVSAGRPGAIIDAPSGQGEAELLSFDSSFTAKLLALSPGESLRADDWPIAPGVRWSVMLTRRDNYAPDARIVKIDGDREVELPRSRLLFFRGESEDGTRLGVSLDPDSGQMRGLSMGPEGLHELVPPEGGRRQQMVVAQGGDRDPRAPTPSWKCSEEEMAIVPGAREFAPAPPSTRSALLAYTKSGVIAVDTDNEFMNLKFGNNTTSATNYIASLFNYINIIYERDLQLIALQGYTILRVSTTADPYLVNDASNADVNELSEFSGYWSAHYGNVKRMSTAMLSGKQPGNGYSASGIAWSSGSPSYTVLCGTSNAYTFSQVFLFAPDTSVYDVLITAHETGHNMGSVHTHCYNPPADPCYNQEFPQPPCYALATSCPAPQTINGYAANGTLMSYCQLSPCGSTTTLAFHPRSLTEYINGNISIASGAGGCIFAVGTTLNPTPTVTSISPPAGALAGSTSVTITGTNFQSGATAAFADLTGSYGLTSVGFVNATTLTASTPAHAAGAVDVVVFNPDQQTGTLRSGFTYTTAPPPPSVSAIAPNSGSTLGGTAVTVAGANFVNGATVSIGGVAATGVSFVNAATLTATTGAHATGTVSVVVRNPDAQTGTLANAFFYAPPPSSVRFYTLTPCRVVDTRGGTAPIGGPALAASEQRLLALAGNCGIPANAVAISVNVAVVPAAAGYMTLFPGNGVNPGSSTINFGAGQVRANNTILRLATDGSGTVAVLNGSSGTNHFILDVNGYFR
jgi:hypothetical protein